MSLELIRRDDLLKPVDSNQLSQNLSLVLQNVEILIPTADSMALEAAGDVEAAKEFQRSLKGLEALDVILAFGSSSSSMIAKVLELKSYVTNPAYTSKYEFLRLPDGTYRDPTWDELIGALKIKPHEFLGEIVLTARKYGVEQARLIIETALPQVAIASAKNALQPKGYKDRELLLTAANVISTKGGGTNIQINNTQTNSYAPPGEAQGLPSWKAINTPEVIDGELVD